MGYLLDSGNPKILCLLVARAREAVSRNSAGRSPGRRRARAHASGGVLRMPCRRAAGDGPGTGNQRPFQRGRPAAEATTHGGYLSQVDSPFGRILAQITIVSSGANAGTGGRRKQRFLGLGRPAAPALPASASPANPIKHKALTTSVKMLYHRTVDILLSAEG